MQKALVIIDFKMNNKDYKILLGNIKSYLIGQSIIMSMLFILGENLSAGTRTFKP